MTRPQRRYRHGDTTLIAMVLLVLVAVLGNAAAVSAQAATPAPPPTIDSVKPAVVKPGGEIRINGTNFIDVKAVTMAGVSLMHKVNSRRRITATAPANATRGAITVSTRGGVIASPRVVVVKPSIEITPGRGPVGSAIGVRGSGFIPGEPVDISYGRLAQTSTTANGVGVFSTSFAVPAKTSPGRSFVRAQGRFSGVPVDARHDVSAAWPQRGLAASGNRHASDDTYLGATAAPSLVLDWVADTLASTRSSPAVVAGQVVAGADTGALLSVAADCATGGRSCQSQALGVARGAVSSSPAILDSRVFVGSEDGLVYAYDVHCPVEDRPCAPLWSYRTEGPVTSSPAVDEEVVVVGSTDGRVYAFDHDCGMPPADDSAVEGDGEAVIDAVCSPRWVAETSGPVRSSPAIHDGVVYVGSDDGYLHAYETGCARDGGSCEPTWLGWTGGVVRSSPTVANGLVYVGSADSKLHGFAIGCADRGRTCQAIWRGAADGPIESSPVVAEGWVVVGTNAGSVMAFSTACANRATGCQPTWTAVTGGPVRSSPAIGGTAQGGSMVFVGSDDGFIYGYPLRCRPTGKPATCQAVWASGTSAPISASPAIVDGAVYVSSEDGTIRRWSLP